MSHTVKVAVKMNNVDALNAAIDALGLERIGGREPAMHRLYGGQQHHGIAVKLPGWNYPVIINPATGEANYDNFGGHWGAQDALDGLVQEYSVQDAVLLAMQHGYSVESDTTEETGERRVVVASYT